MSQADHVEYEVACQTLGQLISHQVAIVAHEEMQTEPDAVRATAADAQRRALVAVRDTLQPGDGAAIAAVLAEYGPRARQMNAELV